MNNEHNISPFILSISSNQHHIMYAILSWLAVGILSLVVLCKLSSRCAYYTKISVFWLILLLLSIMPLPLFIVRPRHWKNAL